MKPIARLAVLATAACVLVPAGCKRGTPPASPPADPAVAAPVKRPVTMAELPKVRIELSEPESEVVFEKVSGRYAFGVGTRVKYRFAEGVPSPDAWYLFETDLGPKGGPGIKEIQGKDLAREGLLENKVLLVRLGIMKADDLQAAGVGRVERDPADFPDMVTITIKQSRGKGGPYQDVSKPITCEVKSRTRFELP